MGELVLFPMRYVSLKKEKRTCTVIYAISSGRIINLIDLPLSWLHTDATLAVTRLISAGWKEEGRGEAKDD